MQSLQITWKSREYFHSHHGENPEERFKSLIRKIWRGKETESQTAKMTMYHKRKSVGV